MSQTFVLHKDSTRASVRDRLVRFLDMLPDDRAWLVEIKRHARRRSDQQNSLLWAMYAPIAEAMGFEKDDLHEWFCGKFWGWKDARVPRSPRNPDGYISIPVRTTTRDESGRRNVIDKDTFSRFVDMVERTAAQAGVYVEMEDAA